MSRKRAGLWLAWSLCFGIGAVCIFIFVSGHLRDTHFGEAKVALDLATPSDEAVTDFRVWKSGPHDIHLTTLDTRSDPATFVPRDSAPRFTGSIAVRVRDPAGAIRLDAVLTGNALDHARPDNVEWTRLATLELGGGPWRAWRLESRVIDGDRRFAGDDGLRSELVIRKRQEDPGMGGLINYVMLFPGILFSGLAVASGVALARGGASRVPAILAGVLLAPVVVLWM